MDLFYVYARGITNDKQNKMLFYDVINAYMTKKLKLERQKHMLEMLEIKLSRYL